MKSTAKAILESAKQMGNKYDRARKNVFRNKEIIAPILQLAVDEFHGLSVDEIVRLIDIFQYLKAIGDCDFPVIEKYAGHIEEQVKEEISMSSGMGQAMFEKGVAAGHTKGLNEGTSKGRIMERMEIIERVMRLHNISEENAMKMLGFTDINTAKVIS